VLSLVANNLEMANDASQCRFVSILVELEFRVNYSQEAQLCGTGYRLTQFKNKTRPSRLRTIVHSRHISSTTTQATSSVSHSSSYSKPHLIPASRTVQKHLHHAPPRVRLFLKTAILKCHAFCFASALNWLFLGDKTTLPHLISVPRYI
jgi:hypothetical protein